MCIPTFMDHGYGEIAWEILKPIDANPENPGQHLVWGSVFVIKHLYLNEVNSSVMKNYYEALHEQELQYTLKINQPQCGTGSPAQIPALQPALHSISENRTQYKFCSNSYLSTSQNASINYLITTWRLIWDRGTIILHIVKFHLPDWLGKYMVL